MLELPGIENDTTSLINSSPRFSRFAHALHTVDIFSIYDKSLLKVKKEKGNAIRRALGGGIHSSRTIICSRLFSMAMELIVLGVVNRDFIFRFPFKNLEVTFKIIKCKSQKGIKGLFRYHRGKVDPFDMGFQMVTPVLQVRFEKRPPIYFNVKLSSNMYAIMMENVKNRKTYENSKIKDLDYISSQVELLYPTNTASSIKSVIRHGLNTIFRAMIRKCDSYIKNNRGDNPFFVYFCNKRDISQYFNIRYKIRFLLNNTKGKPPHDGMYYFFLTNDKKEQFDQGEPMRVSLTRYIQELHIGKSIARHIYQVYLPEMKKKAFFETISKDFQDLVYYEQYIENEFKRI